MKNRIFFNFILMFSLIFTGDLFSSISATIYQAAINRDHNIRQELNSDFTITYAYTDNTSQRLRVGNTDWLKGSEYYSYLTFPLSSISSNAVIISAIVNLKCANRNNGAFIDWPLRADHIKYSNNYDNSTLLPERYNLTNSSHQVLVSSFDTVEDGDIPQGSWWPINALSAVQYAIDNPMNYTENGSDRILQLRLRDSENDGYNDKDQYIEFYSQNNGTIGNRPYLTVQYNFPLSPPPAPNVALLPSDYETITIDWPADENVDTWYLYWNIFNDPYSASQIAILSSSETNYTSTSSIYKNKMNYFWLKGHNAVGFSDFSSVGSVSTIVPAPGRVNVNAPVYLDLTNVAISWSNVANETSYTLFRATPSDNTNSLTKIIGTGKNITSYTDSSSVLGATNWYYVKAYNFYGESQYSVGQSIILDPPDTPTNLSISLYNNNYFQLQWNDCSMETSYTLYRSTNSSTNFAVSIGGLNANTTNYIDYNFPLSVTNFYWVKAYNIAGSSAFSASVWNIFDVPGIPSGLTASLINNNNDFNISWIDENFETSYTLYRSTNNNIGDAVSIGLSADQTNYLDTFFIPGNTNYYWVEAFNRAGGSGTSSSNSITINPPAIPGWTGSIVQGNRITLAWSNSPGISFYKIYKYPSNNPGSASLIGTIPGSNTFFLDSNLPTDTSFFYWVQASNRAGVSGFSTYLSNRTGSIIYSDIPTLNAAYADNSSSSAINLTWNNVQNETGYEIWRNTVNDISTNSTAVLLASLPANTTSYYDLSVTNQIQYYYWIRSFNGAITLGYSAVATLPVRGFMAFELTAINEVEPGYGENKAVLMSWGSPNDGSSPIKYRIYRSTSPVIDFNAQMIYELDSSFFYAYDMDVEYNQSYYYNIAYSVDGVNYILGADPYNSMIMVFHMNDLEINGEGVLYTAITPIYNQLTEALKNPNLSVEGHDRIAGPAVGAYKIDCFQYGPYPKNVTIEKATSKRASKWGGAGVLLDTTYSSTKSSKIYFPDFDKETQYVTFDLGEKVDIVSFEIYAKTDWYGWKKISIYVSDYKDTQFKFLKSVLREYPTSSYEVSLPEEAREGRFLKIIFIENFAEPEIYDDQHEKRFKILQVDIEAQPRKVLFDLTSKNFQDTFNLVLPYDDRNNNGLPEIYNSTTEINESEQDLRIFLLENDSWSYLGGKVNVNSKTVSVQTKNFRKFGIFPVKERKSYPQVYIQPKYFTPDDDGVNDTLLILINPVKTVTLDIRIFDLRGSLVKNLVNNVTISDDFSVRWNGKSELNEDIEIGTYIYEVRFDGKKVKNGLILLAK